MRVSTTREFLQSERAPSNGAREELILAHMRQIRQVARLVSTRLPAHVDHDDLVSAGVIGLIDAIDKFDPRRRVKFTTYAQIRIRGAILDSLRHNDHIPRHLRRRCRNIESICNQLEQSLGRPVAADELSRALRVSLTKTYRLLDQIHVANALPVMETAFADSIRKSPTPLKEKSSQEPDPFTTLQEAETREIILHTISTLPKKERLVILLYYFDRLGLREIAAVLGSAESRVSQFHTQGLRRLAKRLRKAGIATIQ